MGRVSKYATVEERLKASQEQKQKYSQTERAKLLRREQNKRAYQRRTENKSKLAPTWPAIPRALRQQAALPLPRQSHFFLLEYRTREEISDDDVLAKWDFYPPYHIPHGSIGGGGLDAIIDRVHGRRLREQYQYEACRLQRYEKSTDTQILQEIDRDIHTYLTSWEELKHILDGTNLSHVDRKMGEHQMQWKARRVVDLLEDWKAVKKGRVDYAFTCLYTARW
ncbi:hypothetical protein BJ912DRAFT_933030 [Pholiota molesta]|nr:hypothetical protein BJ912DRAFT_933030 [Pholiota molesta]